MGIRTSKSRLGGQKNDPFFVISLRVKTTELLTPNFRASPQLNKVAPTEMKPRSPITYLTYQPE